jgi:hypothetical protein
VNDLHEGLEITPAFAHRTSLRGPRARQTKMNVMAPLVRNDAIVDRAVTLQRGLADHRSRNHAHHDLLPQHRPRILSNAERTNGNRIVRAAHGTRRQSRSRIIGNDGANAACILDIFDFIREGASSAISNDDFARVRPSAARERLTGIRESTRHASHSIGH